MPICLPAIASGEPHVELTLWSVFLLFLPVLGVPTIHVGLTDATTSSPARIGRPAILMRRPSTNTPPMSSSTRACRRDRPSTRAAST